MALKGNLRDFTITQLLNLINLARKTGTLIVDGPGDKITVSFREGVRAAEATGDKGSGGGCNAAAGTGFAPLALLFGLALAALVRKGGK